MAEYTKVLANVAVNVLKNEIEADPGIAPTCLYINWAAPSELKIYFDTTLSGAEDTALDAVIAAHTPPTQVTIISETTIKETTITGGRYKVKGWDWTVPASVGESVLEDITLPYDVDMLDTSIFVENASYGDYIDIYVASDTVIGAVNGIHTATSTVITVNAGAVFSYLHVGYMVKFQADTNEYLVTALDPTNNQFTVIRRDEGSPAGLIADLADGDLVKMTVIMVEDLRIKPDHYHRVGASKIGGSGMSAGTIVRVEYYSIDGAANKKVFMNTNLLYSEME